MAAKKVSIPEFLSVRSVNTACHFPTLRNEAIGDVHDFPEIFYVHRGSPRLLVDGQPMELHEGQLLIYRPMSYHIGTADGSVNDVYILSFDIATDAIATIYNRPITISPELRMRFMELVRGARSLLRSMQESTAADHVSPKTAATDCALKRLGNTLESFLLDLISMEGSLPQIDRRPTEVPAVEAARAYLKRNLHRALTLAEIAEHAHVSVSTLTSRFRSTYGCSVIQYFNMLRIERAGQQLRTGNYSVTETADSLGFSSVHYFSRLYRRLTGHTPSEDFRK